MSDSNSSNIKVNSLVIGICGGSVSGKVTLMNYIAEASNESVCKISLKNYYKNLSKENYKFKENYNFDNPSAIDFDLLFSDLQKLRKGESAELPKYDKKTCIRQDKAIKIAPCSLIIIEGIFCFYDNRIRNLMDLKIFIDTDDDIRLSRSIIKDLKTKTRSLKECIKKYHEKVKPCFKKYVFPSRKYADLILPNVSENAPAIEMILEYQKELLSKIRNKKEICLFSFMNEIIDPKYEYFNGKILIEDEKNNKQIFYAFIKSIFEDFITKQIDDGFIEPIREKLLNKLPSLLIKHFKKKNLTFNVDFVLFENTDLKNINFKFLNNVFVYKTAILCDNDIKIFEKIRRENKDCKIIISTVFLAPKYAEILLRKDIDKILIATLYFSDFFIMFENLIKNDKTIYNNEILQQLFLKGIKSNFNYESIFDNENENNKYELSFN